MYYEWAEMSFYKFPSFQNNFERAQYESWCEDDKEVIEAEEDECLDEAFIYVIDEL